MGQWDCACLLALPYTWVRHSLWKGLYQESPVLCPGGLWHLWRLQRCLWTSGPDSELSFKKKKASSLPRKLWAKKCRYFQSCFCEMRVTTMHLFPGGGCPSHFVLCHATPDKPFCAVPTLSMIAVLWLASQHALKIQNGPSSPKQIVPLTYLHSQSA